MWISIDIMHQLFLGMVKNLFVLVTKSKKDGGLGLLNKAQLEELQRRANRLQLPRESGRIIYKIASKLSGFTADQVCAGRPYLYAFMLMYVFDISFDS
jgi:hypothetical protein